MSRELIHRGPDSNGAYYDSNVALSIRRLKIIDVEGGDQPLFNEDSSMVVVANGEIYNYVELTEDLKKKGHKFKTHSDCETILHLYEEYQENCIHKLRGMFSFALYDKRLKIDPDAVNMYLHYQYVPEPFTCIKGVKKLPAAHFMKLKLKDFSFTLKKYWDIEEVQPVSGNPAELIRESFDELSKYIIRADVPVGVSLSGGLDSSAIACVAAKHSRDKMQAFSVGYPGRPGCDERALAKSLADKLEMEFHDVELRTDSLVDSFPELVYGMDDPIADVAAFGYYSVSKLAREHGVPVLLFGFGGDELFWGYRWARESVKRNLLKKEIRAGRKLCGLPFSEIMKIYEDIGKRQLCFHPVSYAKKIVADMKAIRRKFTENPSRFIFWDEIPDFNPAFGFKKALYTKEFENSVCEERLYDFFTTEDWESVPFKTCKFLLEPWNISNSVVLGDRTSMAFSVESRLPFLDYKFMELVMGLRKTYGDDYKLGSKGWFIEAMRDIIHEEALRRDKRGFTPPRNEWLKAVVDRYGKFCYDGCLVSNGIMRKDRLVDFFSDLSSGKGKLFFAYKVVLLEMWLRKFVEGKECDSA
jgi:asparagine synthase (glutamine-hydrolysing)